VIPTLNLLIIKKKQRCYIAQNNSLKPYMSKEKGWDIVLNIRISIHWDIDVTWEIAYDKKMRKEKWGICKYS
jgi:hypothetical protein